MWREKKKKESRPRPSAAGPEESRNQQLLKSRSRSKRKEGKTKAEHYRLSVWNRKSERPHRNKLLWYQISCSKISLRHRTKTPEKDPYGCRSESRERESQIPSRDSSTRYKRELRAVELDGRGVPQRNAAHWGDLRETNRWRRMGRKMKTLASYIGGLRERGSGAVQREQCLLVYIQG